MKDGEFFPKPTRIERKIAHGALVRSLEDGREKESSAEISPEMRRANRYWQERLAGEYRIETPMDPRCEIGIVVPVMNEQPRRLLRQIESLKAQKGFDPALFEIIYVVNNGLGDQTEKGKKILEVNAQIIDFLRQDHGIRIHVIDKSTAQNGIKDCNVGRARNRGVAEATLRFHENGRNGILLQTDADTWFEDPEYLLKIKEIFDSDPGIIGIAGGLVMEWDPDSENKEERRIFEQKVAQVIRRKLLDAFTKFLRDEDSRRFNDTHFSGAHMLSRSLETAQIGGLIDVAAGEDPQFGIDLTSHAELHGQKVIGKRESVFVTTAFRESDRTEASFKKDFDSVEIGRADLVPNIVAEKNLATFRKEIDAAFGDAYHRNDHLAMRDVMTDAAGSLITSVQEYESLCEYMDFSTLEESTQFLSDFRQRNFGDQDQVRMLYTKAYPPVELTDEYLDTVKRVIRTLPEGEKFVRNIEKAVAMFKLAK